MKVMAEVHERICGSHRLSPKMRWLIHRHGYFLLTMATDCINYARGCAACQKHGPIQRLPAEELYSIIKPWPFRGWTMDLFSKIHPFYSKQHTFIIVVIDYFSEWVEAQPMTKVTQHDVI